MKDSEIIAQFFASDEAAIAACKIQYGGLVRHILRRIVQDEGDVEECESDTWMAAWSSIPPARPVSLRAYLAKIARNLGCKRLEYRTAAKRAPEMQVSLDELGDCIADGTPCGADDSALGEAINAFLASLPDAKRRVFLLRYWEFCSIDEIADMTGFSVSKITSMLYRMREKLRRHLTERGLLS